MCNEIVFSKSKSRINPQSLKISSNFTEDLESVKILGIEIDNHSNFQSHVSTICKNAARQ